MIQINRKEDCCGCGACAQICKKGAIEMQPDAEGFLYPTVNEDVCINCGLCDRVCPVRNNRPETPAEQEGYLAQNRNDSVLSESTSGGVFTALANRILRQGGSVFGAVMDEDFTVFHTHAEQANELAPMRGSKYVQSEIRNSYIEAEDKLKSGQFVLFSGTPCQVEGLLFYLGRDYPNLLTVDVVCHACPSPKIWKAYTEMMLNQTGGQISKFLFRDKTPFGYYMPTMSAYCGPRNTYSEGIAIDPYLRAFFSDICDRPSCYECKFKKRYRKSDLTLWDCFDPTRLSPNILKELDLKKGASCVLAHSAKGKRILKELNADLRLYSVSPDEMANSSHEMRYSVKMNCDREKFFADVLSLSSNELFSRYFPIRWKNKGEDMIRKISLRFGIYNSVKKAAKRLLPRFKRR